MTQLPRNTIFLGDCIEILRTLPDESVNCCVTSPPYWGLRDYGVDGQIGLEETPEAFVQKMVAVFSEVRRVLRPDGTCWINLGDSYASTGKNRTEQQAAAKTGLQGGMRSQFATLKQPSKVVEELKPKDLVGIPWMVAFALRADGWYLRQEIIWNKPNPMPESVTDRCTKAHEQIFLLTKSPRYWFDAEAIKEECSESTHARISQNVAAQVGSFRANGGGKTNGPMKAVIAGSTRKLAKEGRGIKNNNSFETACVLKGMKRNKRSVWTVPTQSFTGAHFATFPEKLIEPCILAGCPDWVCPACGKPRERLVEKSGGTTGRSWVDHSLDATVGLCRKDDSVMQRAFESGDYTVKTTGWTDCGCNAGWMPGVVLDPFMGAGTTGLVAYKNRRDYLGTELNPEYKTMSEKRIGAEMHNFVLFTEGAKCVN